MSRKEVEVLFLSREDVERNIEVKEAIDIVEEAQREWGNGQTENGPLIPMKFKDIQPERHGNFMYGCAYLKNMDVSGMVWTAVFRDNPSKYGLPFATGIEIINDTVTGQPLAVMERSKITEMVTAATSAVGAKYLARADSKVLGIVGCGAQGRTHLQAIKELFDIKTVKVFDAKKEFLEKYIEEMSDKADVDIQPAESAEEVVSNSDIVVTVINPAVPLIKYNMIKPGSLVIAACGARELYDDVCNKMDKFTVDDWEHILERYRFKDFLSRGIITRETPHLELGKIIAGKQKGRENNNEKILFVHAGMIINHIAIGHLIYKKAKENGAGKEFRVL
ncbi:MAG: ornithine cyclodeaminase family protein [bacterium]|nr:ornithine cyclodeaminase family protein [bacterium]